MLIQCYLCSRPWVSPVCLHLELVLDRWEAWADKAPSLDPKALFGKCIQEGCL